MTAFLNMQRQVSIHRPMPSDVNIHEVAHLLEGKLDDIPQINSKIIRVFVSSTFSDTIRERNILMEKAYPKLKEFCRERHGLEFQMVDLRWGIREESQDDHTIIDFCLQEIENCQKTSLGPNFVLFLGQKYGYRPFPPVIPADQFTVLRESLVHEGRDVSMLDKWFQKDDNVVPPKFNLLPISSILEHFNDKVNPELMAKDREEWFHIFQEILGLLRHAATQCLQAGTITQEQRDKFFISVTEYEIEKGLIKAHDTASNCVVFSRNIVNLAENTKSKHALGFIDMKPGTQEVDQEAQNLLRTLKEEKIPKALALQSNTANLSLMWGNPAETDPNQDEMYLQRFCNVFVDKMYEVIARSVKKINELASDDYVVEVIQHLQICKRRAEVFRGREEVLQRIYKYVTNHSNQPMVVHGVSGSGKTSTMAKVASLIPSWFPNVEPVTVLRFLGTTARSCSVRLVLGSMCWQIAAVYGHDITDIPGDYPGLIAYFQNILQLATAERPLVIILDSVDQLLATHRSYNLVWLPKLLPPHVHILVSTLPKEHGILETLQDQVTEMENYVEVPPLGQRLSGELLQEWLSESNHKLTMEQDAVVKDALEVCSLPLYTRLVFKEICRWKSYTSPDQLRLGSTVKAIINSLFDRVERYYGRTFVIHALSYLTASKNGLSDTELEDLLSLDDCVLNDVFIHWLPPMRRIPPLMWPRLHNELSSYITQREANGVIVFYWYHRQFISVAKERYFAALPHKLYIHSSLAHYFLGTWGGASKPFRYSTAQVEMLKLEELVSTADRKAPIQPLILGVDTTKNPPKVRYNLRKLSELPYHLIESKRYTDLRKEVFFNYEWLHSKLTAMSIHDLLSDFRMAAEAGLDDLEVQLLASAIRVGGSHVNLNPDTLAFDLTGRLLPYYNSHKNIRILIQQCDTISLRHSALLPVYTCYESPRGMLHYILEDHTKVVFDLIFSKSTNELISVSRDHTIAFWDLNSGERTRAIDISALSPGPQTRLLQSSDGKYLICDSDSINSPVYIFDLKTGHLLHKVGARLPTQKRVFVAGNLLCRQKNIIDLRSGQIVKNLDDFVPTKKYVTCHITPDDQYILIGEDMNSGLFHIASGRLMTVFPSEHMISACEFSANGKEAYVGYTEDCMMRVFDVDPDSPTFGDFLLEYDFKAAFPKVKFCGGRPHGNELAEIAISPQDPDMLLLNIKRVNLVLLNIRTQESKLLDMNTLYTTGGRNPEKMFLSGATFSKERQYVLAGEDHFLYVWSSETCRLLSTVTLHSVHKFPLAVSEQNNMVATGSTIHTAIKMWNLNKIESHEGNQLQIYENPIDMVTSSPDRRLMFVKRYHGMTSARGYKFHNCFGIDVWNLNTGHSQPFLPFSQYGQLLQMEVSHNGLQMALLLSSLEETYTMVLNLLSNKIVATLAHHGSTRFVLSSNSEYIVTMTDTNGDSELRLWNIKKSSQMATFGSIKSPMFTLDNNYLLFVEGGRCIQVYSLKKQAVVHTINYMADKIQSIPNKPEQVLVTYTIQEEDGPSQTQVAVMNFMRKEVKNHLAGVAPRGICDITKDGQRAIDSFLQVYNLQSSPYPNSPLVQTTEEFPFVRMTHDGKYTIWVDDLTLKVARLKDGLLIGNMSTHEKPTSIELFDFGYLIVIGREDGHILTVKLVDEELVSGVYGSEEQVAPRNAHVRAKRLLERPVCTLERVRTFDQLYQQWPQPTHDSHLPEASIEMQTIMLDRARVVHTIIKTSSLTNLAMYAAGELGRDRQRRSSSPLAQLFGEVRRSRESSPHAKAKEKSSPKAKHKLLHTKRCPSLHDLFSTGSTSKAIHSTGVMLMTLTQTDVKSKTLPKKHRFSLPKLANFAIDPGMPVVGPIGRDRTPSV